MANEDDPGHLLPEVDWAAVQKEAARLEAEWVAAGSPQDVILGDPEAAK